MAVAFRLPDLGEGITEAEIIEWLVSEGETVAEHQPILRVETDKALVEIPAPASGRIGRIRHHPGDTVHAGELLVSILGEGETEERSSTSVVGVLPDEPVELPPQAAPSSTAPSGPEVLATPAVRRIARELGVRIEDVTGSGAGGRVTEADVRDYAESSAGQPRRAEERPEAVERIALRGIRRTIARRLKTAVTHAALATHMDEVDVSALVELRRATQADGSGGTFPWIVKATALTLKQHPRFNATLDDAHEEVLVNRGVHIGIAVDTRDGLMVPVIRDADRKTIREIATDVERLAGACRSRAVEMDALRGGTFSISNIGTLGGTYAIPIPNYPEVAILATGRIAERLARADDGAIISRHVLPVSLSFDHRVVDGADAARFVNTLKELLGRPEELR